MKVCHIIVGLNDGGAEGTLYRLISSTSNTVDHLVVSLMGKGKYGEKLEQIGVSVCYLDMPRGKLTLAAVIRLYLLLRKERPDLVQTWMYHADLIGGIVAKIAGRNNIIWGIRHSNLFADANKSSTLLVVKFCAFFSRLIPVLAISCADEAVRTHLAFGYKNKFVVVPNGCDTELFRPELSVRNEWRNKWQVDASVPVLGFVARWDYQKGHKYLLEALSKVRLLYPSVLCVLVGTGCDKHNIELGCLIDKFGLEDNMRLLGRSDNVNVIMNAFDLHILPSVGEGFPNVVSEAMSCGIPCVVTDVGDAAIIVDDTGWIVPAADHEVLCEVILEALSKMDDTVSWNNRRSICRSRIVNEFGIDKMAKNYIKIWSDSMSG